MGIEIKKLTKIIYLCIGVALLLTGHLGAEPQEDTPERPILGPQRLLPDQPFVGRYDETLYKNYGFDEYPRLPPFTNSLRPYYSDLGDFLIYGSNSVNWRQPRPGRRRLQSALQQCDRGHGRHRRLAGQRHLGQ